MSLKLMIRLNGRSLPLLCLLTVGSIVVTGCGGNVSDCKKIRSVLDNASAKINAEMATTSVGDIGTPRETQRTATVLTILNDGIEELNAAKLKTKKLKDLRSRYVQLLEMTTKLYTERPPTREERRALRTEIADTEAQLKNDLNRSCPK